MILGFDMVGGVKRDLEGQGFKLDINAYVPRLIHVSLEQAKSTSQPQRNMSDK